MNGTGSRQARALTPPLESNRRGLMHKVRKLAAGLVTSGLLAAGIAAPSAGAAPVVVGPGLVNVGVDVDLDNVLSNNEVIAQVPIGVAANLAANVCVGYLTVGVLAQQLVGGNTVSCVAETGQNLLFQRTTATQ
jgi:hypothetical protein